VLVYFLAPGTLAGWLTLAVLVYGLVIFRSGGGGAAIGSLKTANEVLARDNHALKAQIKNDEATIAALHGSRDFGTAIRPLIDTVVKHEQAEEAAFAAMLLVLDRIASKLGPE
jgi:hypothetical protein